MAKENATLITEYRKENLSFEGLSFEELDEKIEDKLRKDLEDLDFLYQEREKINNPEHLGTVIQDIVWEQFVNQMAVSAGEDFIRENRGLHLDLSNDAHIQTVENFEKGKIASHNPYIDFQKRYDDYQNNFRKDPLDPNMPKSRYRYNEELQVQEKLDSRSGKFQKVLKSSEVRKDFDKGRPVGNMSKNIHADHTVSVGEILRDPEANTYLSKEQQIEFANSEKNINMMDGQANQSKGDSTMEDFLNSKRDGKTAAERFGLDEAELRKKDAEAREDFEKRKKKGKEEAIKTGKQSQKEEAFRIGGSALKAAVMRLLAELVKKIIAKLIKWFKSAQKNIHSLIDSLRDAIKAFLLDIKTHLISAGDAIFTTVATAIFGPIIRTIRKVWTLLKQGWKSLKEAINYLRDPKNKGKPFSILLLEIGKILIAGLTAAGSIVLGEVIEKGLMTVPIFAIEIPLFGSLASIIGLFLGAMISGIVGAIAISIIEGKLEKKRRNEIVATEMKKSNEILDLQLKQRMVSEECLVEKKKQVVESICHRHQDAATKMNSVLENLKQNNLKNISREERHKEIDSILNSLLN